MTAKEQERELEKEWKKGLRKKRRIEVLTCVTPFGLRVNSQRSNYVSLEVLLRRAHLRTHDLDIGLKQNISQFSTRKTKWAGRYFTPLRRRNCSTGSRRSNNSCSRGRGRGRRRGNNRSGWCRCGLYRCRKTSDSRSCFQVTFCKLFEVTIFWEGGLLRSLPDTTTDSCLKKSLHRFVYVVVDFKEKTFACGCLSPTVPNLSNVSFLSTHRELTIQRERELRLWRRKKESKKR
jgi:hypothetical protein